jgi:hypothetical protein
MELDLQSLFGLHVHSCARNYRPCFRENQPKRSFSIKWKRAFWACFRENWVYKFGHCTHWLRPRNTPPPHLGSYKWALLVSQDRRHLFGTPYYRYIDAVLNHIAPLPFFLCDTILLISLAVTLARTYTRVCVLCVPNHCILGKQLSGNLHSWNSLTESEFLNF